MVGDSWKPSGKCSVTCGNGTKAYTRTCDNPIPGSHISNCIGNDIEYRVCTKNECPAMY